MTKGCCFSIICWQGTKTKQICESGGIGRRARLRGVWLCHTGSIPVSRTIKKQAHRCLLFLWCDKRKDTSLCLHKLGSHFCQRRSLLASVSLAEIARLASLPVFTVSLLHQAHRCLLFLWCDKRKDTSLCFHKLGSHFYTYYFKIFAQNYIEYFYNIC